MSHPPPLDGLRVPVLLLGGGGWTWRLVSHGSSSILHGREAQMPPAEVLLVPRSLFAPCPAVPSPALMHPQAALPLLGGEMADLETHL